MMVDGLLKEKLKSVGIRSYMDIEDVKESWHLFDCENNLVEHEFAYVSQSFKHCFSYNERSLIESLKRAGVSYFSGTSTIREPMPGTSEERHCFSNMSIVDLKGDLIKLKDIKKGIESSLVKFAFDLYTPKGIINLVESGGVLVKKTKLPLSLCLMSFTSGGLRQKREMLWGGNRCDIEVHCDVNAGLFSYVCEGIELVL